MHEPFICPPDHKHATTGTCHSAHGCRCPDCKTAHTEYSYWWRHMNAAGRPLNSDVDARGTRRRLQALSALGWSAGAIGAHLGNDQTVVSRWMIAERVTRATAEKVAAVYDLLSNTPPPTATHGQRLSRARTIARARRLDYALPIEWDDIDTDETPSRPAASVDIVDVVVIELAAEGRAPRPLTRSERRTAVEYLSGTRRLPDTDIGKMLGVDEKTIASDRAALNLPAAVGHDRVPLPRKAAA